MFDRLPFYTKAEYQKVDYMVSITPVVGSIFGFIMILHWLTDEQKKKQHLVIAFTTVSFLLSTTIAIFNNLEFKTVFCKSNAVPHNASDGLTGCAIESFLFVYLALGICYAWMIQSVDLFLKIYYNLNTTPYRWLQFLIIFGCPMISIIILGATKSYG